MADGVGFAHYEFPSEQGRGYASLPHYETFDLEAGGLVEQASAEIPAGRSYGSNRLFEVLNQSQDVWKGFPVADEERVRREDLRYARDWKSREADRIAQESVESSVPWEFQSLTSGPAAGVESMGAAVMRLIDPETSDWMVRATQARGMGHEIGMSKEELSSVRKWFNTNLYGASRSLTQAAIAAGLAKVTGGSSLAIMAGTFGATSANDSYVEAIDYGLPPKKAFNYAWKQGAFEAGVMTVFHMVGLGGFEKALVGGSIWKSLSKEFGKDFLAELTEEEITTVMQEMSRVAAMPEGKYRNAWIGDDGTFESSPMKTALLDTASQTLFMMGGPRAAGGAARASGKAWSFLIDPSRNSILVMPDAVRGPLEEKHGSFKDRDNRQAASDDLLGQYVGVLDSKKETEAEVDYWRSVAEDEGRTENARTAASGVASRLEGGDFNATGVGKELLEIISERMSKRDESTSTSDAPVIPAPEAAQERKVEVPQAILQQDPNAQIVDPLDMSPKDDSDDTLVRMLSVVRELGRETRGGRDVRFVQTSDPNVKGVYSGDGIFVTIPKVQKYMKDGVLDGEGLRKALTGTFAHEYTHDLKSKAPEAWDRLYDALSKVSKYAKLLKKGRDNFLTQFEKSAGLDVDPYSNYRAEGGETALEELAKEESLAYLMDSSFITTGLVSKIAKTDSNAFEMLRDWLRRIRNSLFGDKLYKGMVGVFNEVSGDMGIQPIAVRPITESVPDKPKKKKAKKPTKRSRKHSLSKGLPEWAEGPVADLEKRGSKVTQKNYASPSVVVVTVRTKAGNTQIVTIRRNGMKNVQKATSENYNAKMDDAVDDAMTIESYSEDPEPAPERPTTPTDQLNEDIGKQYSGLREGLSDEDVEIESTDIDAFYGLLESVGSRDENGEYLGEADVSDIDTTSLRERGLVYVDEDGRFRLTSLGMRVMAWEGPDEVGRISENEPDELDQWLIDHGLSEDDRFSLAIEGLDDKDTDLMELAILTADIALTASPYTGRAFDLIDEVWEGDIEGEITGWLRKNKPDALKNVVETVWNEHHEGMLKSYGGNLSRFVPLVRKRMITGRHVSTDRAEMNLLRRAKAVVPHPNEYRQLGDSSERMSIKVHDLDLPDEYYDETSKHHVDERTRAAVDKVRAYAHIKTPAEIRTHIQDEAHGQAQFNRDPLAAIKYLIEKGFSGEIFTSRDWVMASEGHAFILKKMDAGGLTAAEYDDLTQKMIWLAQYSDEAGSEWGRAGSMMRDRVETVRERSRRAIDKAIFSKSENIRRKLAYWQSKLMGGLHPDAKKRVAEVRQEWMEESKATMDRLRAKGWDLDQLDKYMGSREAVEAFVYEVLKDKGAVGTASHIAYEMFINFILSGPLTHMANVVSNTAFITYEMIPKRIVHSVMNELSLAVGLGDKMAPRIGELPHLYKHMAIGFYEGAKHFWRSYVTEEESFERMLGLERGRTKFETHRRHIKGPAGRIIRGVGTTFLTAMDSWAKSVNAYGEVAALAYRDAKHNGLVDDQVGKFLDEVMLDKTHRLWGEALTIARDRVFQGEPSPLAKGALHIRRTVPGAKWFLPFILTPDNLLRKGVAYSPFGTIPLGKGVYNGFKSGDWSGVGERTVQQLFAYAFVAALMGDDEDDPFITGTTPDQPKEWSAEKRSRTIPPLSIKVGDGYISYARFEPFSTWIALTKDVTVAIKKGDFDFAREKLGESVIEMMKDKPMMRVVSDVGYLIRSPGKASARIAGGFITSASPNLYKQIVRASRDHAKERRTWGDEDRFVMWGKNLLRKAEIPIFEDYDKFDQYGEKIPENYNPTSGTKASFWYKLLVPAKGKHVHEGVADKVLRRWNEQNPEDRKGIREPDPWFREKGEDVYLTKEEYSEYTELTGKIFKGLADSEAVDIENPKAGDIESLWENNWNASKAASEKILKKKWSGLPYKDDAKAISQKIYENNINKRITILARPNPSLRNQDSDVKGYTMGKRKEALDAEMKELIETKQEAAEFLVRQGYTDKNFPKLTRRKSTVSWHRAIRSFKNFSGGVTGERKRDVPPRVRGTRKAS